MHIQVQVQVLSTTSLLYSCDAVDGGGNKACSVWLENETDFANSSSSVEKQRPSNVTMSDSDPQTKQACATQAYYSIEALWVGRRITSGRRRRVARRRQRGTLAADLTPSCHEHAGR